MDAFEASVEFGGGLDDCAHLHAWLDSLPWASTDLDAKSVSRIRLALAEAFSNAVLHAHGGQAGLPVRIHLAFTPAPESQVQLDITDCGPGFVLPSSTAPHPDAERGRGLLLLRKVAERIEYLQNTLTIWMRFP
ncbi:MAG TPA: ATP-binding protein [Candidatus Limnocylindria bacterium]|jgi:serine/threonine-protein kinase RsbW|nr:ATP-binding protein [Candidatus Limnocylindria bacterium]